MLLAWRSVREATSDLNQPQRQLSVDDQVFECDIPVAKADEGDDGDTSGKVSLTCEQVVH